MLDSNRRITDPVRHQDSGEWGEESAGSACSSVSLTLFRNMKANTEGHVQRDTRDHGK